MSPRFTIIAVALLLFAIPSCKAPYTHPPGLELGSQYHLVFVTAGERNAESSVIDDYNTFVQLQAEASTLSLPSTTWKAIASTESESARTNVGSGNGPVYLVDGSSVVADSINELFSGSDLQTPINITQNGDEFSSEQFTWTGTAPGGISSDNPLGSRQPERGDLQSTNGQLWLTANNSLLSSSNQPLYAISGPITVTSINPMPDLWSLLECLALASVGLVIVTSRRNAGDGRK